MPFDQPWILIVGFALIFLLQLFKSSGKKRGKSNSRQGDWSNVPASSNKIDLSAYQRKKYLFSQAERSFYGVLEQSIDGRAVIFAKVRVADVIKVNRAAVGQQFLIPFNKITGKHFDYVLCDPNNFEILCAIELDDKSHDNQKRVERDKFLEAACQSAQMPLVRFKAQYSYSIAEVRQMLELHLPGPTQKQHHRHAAKISDDDLYSTDFEQRESTTNNAIKDNFGERYCLSCDAKMVIRTRQKGKNSAEKFWGCSNFPKCLYIEPQN